MRHRAVRAQRTRRASSLARWGPPCSASAPGHSRPSSSRPSSWRAVPRPPLHPHPPRLTCSRRVPPRRRRHPQRRRSCRQRQRPPRRRPAHRHRRPSSSAGRWVSPKAGATVSTDVGDALGEAKCNRTGTTTFTKVVFSATWAGAGTKVMCTATAPGPGGTWACKANLRGRGARPGKVTLGFNVGGEGVPTAKSPDGTREITWAVPPGRPVKTSLTQIKPPDFEHGGNIGDVPRGVVGTNRLCRQVPRLLHHRVPSSIDGGERRQAVFRRGHGGRRLEARAPRDGAR